MVHNAAPYSNPSSYYPPPPHISDRSNTIASPITSPLDISLTADAMPYATHEEPYFATAEDYPIEIDLCDLLQTMKLDSSAYETRKKEENIFHVAAEPQKNPDDIMVEDLSYHSDAASESSSSSSNTSNHHYGCAYLRAIGSQMEDYATTGGEYLNAIFTHREILYSYPAAHQECARAFSDIAYKLETRAWRSDREADQEAVSAFRHEAWVIASSLAPVTTQPKEHVLGISQAPHSCVMMPMA